MDRLSEKYKELDRRVRREVLAEEVIQPDLLLTFPYEAAVPDVDIRIETEEFTAVCPWTGLPDFGRLVVEYVPKERCVELKSLKYYLHSFRSVGIVQERAAKRILDDLVRLTQPVRMKVALDYNVRGGLHTVVTATYPVSSPCHGSDQRD